MIKISELKEGDLILAEYEGQKWEGIVTEINQDDKEINVETAVQTFWYKPEHLYPIPISDEQLFKLGFIKEEMEDGTVKYLKDSFRLLLPRKGDFSVMDIWWREDRRHISYPMYVHDLQNHYYQMTKVELNEI